MDNVVERIDPVSGRGRQIYRSSRWSTRDLTVSLDGQHLGLIEVDRGVVQGHNYQTAPAAQLLVIDTSGAVVRRIEEDVQRYVWCGADCVAYIAGTANESDYGFAPAPGIHVYNLASGTSSVIASNLYPYQLVWAPFDSSVYFKASGPGNGVRVFRLTIATGVVTPTPVRDLSFSADGRYSLHYPNTADIGFHLFETLTNKEVRLPDSSRFTPIQWLPSGPSHLLLIKRFDERRRGPGALGEPLAATGDLDADRDYVVYDVATQHVVGSLHGHVPRWSSRPGVVPFVSGGKPRLVSQPRP